MTYDHYSPGWLLKSMASGQIKGNSGIRDWIQSDLSSKKIVLGLPFYCYVWRLMNANNHGLFALAATLGDGSIGYRQIRDLIWHNVTTAVHKRM
ncbi:hypothetical protein FNV43_RR03980 [Rhamnella rubrinervis]|uniref:Uncharacterized protein n=1 Tax=Rhamnella rubrinervis TaxID=2594499 RepID=A0A8K0HKV4_9ROSA|nr:hypothetical protein FNV43_RR03980 [Rhamnella rubrinervis]